MRANEIQKYRYKLRNTIPSEVEHDVYSEWMFWAVVNVIVYSSISSGTSEAARAPMLRVSSLPSGPQFMCSSRFLYLCLCVNVESVYGLSSGRILANAFNVVYVDQFLMEIFVLWCMRSQIRNKITTGGDYPNMIYINLPKDPGRKEYMDLCTQGKAEHKKKLITKASPEKTFAYK